MKNNLHEEYQQEYLKAVLGWLDIQLESEVCRWQLAGQDPTDRFRGLHISDSEARDLFKRAPGESWRGSVTIPENDETRDREKLKKAWQKILSIETEADKNGSGLRLKELKNIFQLNDLEWKSLIICLAPALDLRYERIYGYLQDDVTRTQPSVDLILTLLNPDGFGRLEAMQFFQSGANLVNLHILNAVGTNGHALNHLKQAYQVAPAVVSWLLGIYQTDQADTFLSYIPHAGLVDTQNIYSILAEEGIPSAEIINATNPILSFYGEDAFLLDMNVSRLAAALEKACLKLKLPHEIQVETALDHLQNAVRDSMMLNAVLSVHGMDVFIDRDDCLSPEVFRILCLTGGCVICCSRKPFRLADDMDGNDHPLMSRYFPKPSSGEREDLWNALLEGIPGEDRGGIVKLLAGQFNLSTGQIIAAASSAMSTALQHNRNLSGEDLFEASRMHSGNNLSGLAQKIAPRYSWEDLVLPETPISMLHELVSMVKSRPQVLEDWGLGKKLTSSYGVSALFTGPPGTGKTLAAQIIANELGIDLYRIDLSTVVSKYIGETEKNLEKIFNEAQTSNAILFFDEADTIFGKRSEVKDAHDRYANIEVGYLLQRMEAYDGVAILATNLRANLDEAFTRRLQFIINFPFPEEDYRLRIWEILMPPGLPRAKDLDLRLMAGRFKLAGGSIRNSIVTAAFLAADENPGKTNHACVQMKHLMHGVRRELQKIGKLVQESDFDLSQ